MTLGNPMTMSDLEEEDSGDCIVGQIDGFKKLMHTNFYEQGFVPVEAIS